MIAAKLATLGVGANQHAQICAPSQSEAGKLLNVSRRAVQTATTVHRHGTPSERDEQVARWIELTVEATSFQTENKPTIGRPTTVGVSEAERKLGVKKDSAHRVAIAAAVAEKVGERRGNGNVQNIAQYEGIKTRTIAAEKSGFGNPETLRQAKAVVATNDAALIDAMDSGRRQTSEN